MARSEMIGTNIIFEQGIPGFDNLRLFQVSKPFDEYPFFYLQSLEEQEVCFLTVNPFELVKAYEIDLPPSAEEALSIKDPGDVAILSIINTHGGLSNATVNLQAPIVINVNENKGMQLVIQNSNLSLREPLKNLLKGTGGK